jgi:hypothetical protein
MGNHREEMDKGNVYSQETTRALDSQVKTLTKKKNENENALKDLESINLKNVSLLKFEEFKRKTKKVEKEKLMEDKKKY